MSLTMISSGEMALHLARQAQKKRLSLNFSQRTLAERSRVSYGALKKFEQTGRISLESLLKIALILESLSEFETLFKSKPAEEFKTLDELIHDKKRKRGRK